MGKFIKICIMMLCVSFAGCGSLGGKTKPVTVKIEKPSGIMPKVELGVVDYDAEKMYHQNTTPFKCPAAQFTENDLSNFKVSLERGISRVTGEKSPSVKINAVVRGNMIAYSNGEVAILSSVDWCLSDSNGQIIFQESFYAAKHYGAIAMKTLGGAKMDIMSKMVKRVVGTANGLANGNTDIKPIDVDDVYTSFTQAVSKLPANITFHTQIAGMVTRHKTDWTILESMDELNWKNVLGKKGL